jgi:predicted DsbA family dithiol-disulfide isomerase
MSEVSASASPLVVDVVSDVVCPWCYIGKRRLESAMSELCEREPKIMVDVRWHPFQLNPDLPKSGIDRRAYVTGKFGGPEHARDIYARVRSVADSVGLALDFDRIARQPNTLDAHRLVAWASRTDPRSVDALVEELFRAFFVDGLDIGDRDVLCRLGEAAGYDAKSVRALLDSHALEAEVAAADRRSREAGIGGVPFFVFGQRVAVSGAQEPRTLLAAIASVRGTR